jgi:hypothetical protein
MTKLSTKGNKTRFNKKTKDHGKSIVFLYIGETRTQRLSSTGRKIERMKGWKEQESTNWEWKWNWKIETKNKSTKKSPLFSENSRRKRKGTCLLYIVCASRRCFDQGDQKQGCGKCTKNVWRRWCRDINNIDVHSPAAAEAVQAWFLVVTSSATDSIAFIHQGNEEFPRPTTSLSLSFSLSLVLGYGDGHRKQSTLFLCLRRKWESPRAGKWRKSAVKSRLRLLCHVNESGFNAKAMLLRRASWMAEAWIFYRPCLPSQGYCS